MDLVCFKVFNSGRTHELKKGLAIERAGHDHLEKVGIERADDAQRSETRM
jgi:hypothetical protein